MSVFNLVKQRFINYRVGNDDGHEYYYAQAVNSLTPGQKEIYFKECEIADKLDQEYGFYSVTEDMYEQAFIDAGLEQPPTPTSAQACATIYANNEMH